MESESTTQGTSIGTEPNPENDVGESVGTTINAFELFSSYSEIFNSTELLNGDGSDGALHDWQIILIASLSAGGIVIIACFILMWKYCSRKPPITTVHTRSVTPGPASLNDGEHNSKSFCCCLGSDRHSNAAANRENAQTTMTSTNQPPFHLQKEQSPGQQQTTQALERRSPLPPIGDGAMDLNRSPNDQALSNNDPLAIGRAHMMPRRLAPLSEQGKITATNLAGGTVVHRASAYGPVLQNVELRGIPSLPIPMDQRRPLPLPPPLAD